MIRRYCKFLRMHEESLLQLVCQEQKQDQELLQLMDYLDGKCLPDDVQAAKNVIGQAKKGKGHILIDGILYHEGGEFPNKLSSVDWCFQLIYTARLLMSIMMEVSRISL